MAQSRQLGAGEGFGQGFLTDLWYFAALSREVRPGAARRYEILGEPVMLGRSAAGELIALRDICPHRAAPLSAGRLTREADGTATIECPFHGWRFAADGRCTTIPSLTDEQDFDISQIRVRHYPVVESQEMIFVWIGSDPRAAPSAPPPHFPGVVGARPRLVERMTFDAHIDHAAIGLMDPAHGSFVHRQWWWRSAASRHAKVKAFAPAPLGFTMLRHPPSSNSRAYALLGGQPLTEITFQLPGYRWEHVTVGKRQVLALTCLTPISASATRITQIVWSDHPVFRLLGPLIRLGAKRFLKQDGDMVNLQNQGLKYQPPLLWVDDADRQAKWYQALKREWSASRRADRPFRNPVEAATLKWTS